MKLESTLRRRSGFLHVVPVLDVVFLVLIFFLLGSGFALQSGIAVDAPESPSVLRPLGRAHVITVSAGDRPRIVFNDQMVTMDQLTPMLEGNRELTSTVLIRADRLAAYGLVMEVSNLAQAAGYSVALATQPSGQR